MSVAVAAEERVSTRCPSCGDGALHVFYEQLGVPSHSCLLMESAEEARDFPRGDIRLALCHGCGFVTNIAFDQRLSAYSARYEETQGFSPRFRAFAERLARRWIECYGLRGKDLVEIGCGKGEFLTLMCDLGDNRGVGIDPAFVPERLDSPAAGRMRFLREYYGPAHGRIPADAILCRHTLEHIPQPEALMRLLRSTIAPGSDPMILFDLPDVVRVLREAAFWDIYYEHCSYFSPGSLARLFRRAGFTPLELYLEYDDQYIVLDARPAPGTSAAEPLPAEESPERMRAEVESFQSTLEPTLSRWREAVAGVRGARTVIWGAGSKGVAFLTTLGIEREIELAVDINPFKHDRFMAGTGQRVVSPEFLREYRPELVIAMNPVYTAEIRRELDALGVDCDLVAV